MSSSAADTARNIIVFGQTGAGKSSLINMLAGSLVANVSSELLGGTPFNRSHEILAPSNTPSINQSSETYTFWDTPGLNEGEFGTVGSKKAMDNLFNLAQERRFHLLMYCVRPERFNDVARVNYEFFWRIVCDKQVPIVLVVTGLEQEENKMDDWWTRNKKTIQGMGIKPHGHACVTSTRGTNDIYKEEYEESAREVWELVKRHCSAKSWTITPERSAKVMRRMNSYIADYEKHCGTLLGKLKNKISVAVRIL